jgi:hypothetical protein
VVHPFCLSPCLRVSVVNPHLFTPKIPPHCTSSGAICTMSALMIKAIFRLTDIEKQKIYKLREMGVRPPDIARRFGLSEGVVHKIIQSQRALLQPPKVAPQSELLTSADLHKQEAS